MEEQSKATQEKFESAQRACFKVEREESETFDRVCNSLCKGQTLANP